MYQIDFNNKIHVHFIGIGGISMSGLAEILLGAGFSVSGSDQKESSLTKQLCDKGAKIAYPQSGENITDDIDVIVYTAAIREDNPEMIAAVASGKPMLTRAELLGQIMDNYKNSIAISGTHGKTTTTSMISQILLEGKDDPTISVGGILEAIHSNVHVGDSDIFVTEACEYTNSFHSFFPKYNIILNVEADHLDFFKNLENVRASFKKFAGNTKSDGLLIVNNAIPNLNEITEGLDCQILKYGMEEGADIYPSEIEFNAGFASYVPIYKGNKLGRIELRVPGEHNISNSLAVIMLAIEMEIPYENIVNGLKKFHGADRRFQFKGKFNGATVIDDYAHHPTEISASLSAAANFPKNRLIVVFQPHTYTRTLSFMDDFAKALSVADMVILADIYAAREPDIYGISSNNLTEKLSAYPCETHYLGTFENIEKFLEKNIINDDLLITMGAGDVYLVGEHLLKI